MPCHAMTALRDDQKGKMVFSAAVIVIIADSFSSRTFILSLSNSVSVKRSRKDKDPRLQGGKTGFESKCGYIVLLILKHTSKFKKTHAKSKIPAEAESKY